MNYDLCIRDDIVKILEKDRSKHLCDFGVGKQTEKNYKLPILKLRNSVFQKTSLRDKWVVHRGEETIYNAYIQKRPISRSLKIYKSIKRGLMTQKENVERLEQPCHKRG